MHVLVAEFNQKEGIKTKWLQEYCVCYNHLKIVYLSHDYIILSFIISTKME